MIHIDKSKIERLRIASLMDVSLTLLSLADMLGQRRVIARMILSGDSNNNLQETYDYINKTIKDVMGVE